MKKLSDIKTLIQEPNMNELVVSEDVKKYIEELLGIAKEFNECSKHNRYEFEIKPIMIDDVVEHIEFLLKKHSKINSHNQESKVLFNYKTHMGFVKMPGYDSYLTEDNSSIIDPENSHLSMEFVSFKKNIYMKNLYKQIVENILVESFLNTEKSSNNEQNFEKFLTEKRKNKIS